jgi:sugar phosphate isomerase/epimerase
VKFSFMTFSCPDLSWDDVLRSAERCGYDGVEPRAQAGHAHGIEVTASLDQRRAIGKAAQDAGIEIACLATSCRYALADPAETEGMLEESRELIQLANDIAAPRLRVFGGTLPHRMSRDEAVDRVADALAALADDADQAGVTLCVETHDSWCDARELARVIRRVDHPSVRVNWDIMHPVRAGLTIDEAFEAIGPFTEHCHVHDGRPGDDGIELCPIGQGAIDHRRAIELLKGSGYRGHLSGEWINWEPWEEHLPRELQALRALDSQTMG